MMRRFVFAVALAAFAAVPSAAHAQVTAAATLAYHNDADLGIGGSLTVPVPSVHPQVRFQGEFLWFFPGDGAFFGAEGADVDYWEINGNAVYDFSTRSSSRIPFILGGLNVANGNGNTELGLNLGGGVTFGEGTFRPSVGVRVELEGGDGVVVFGSFVIG